MRWVLYPIVGLIVLVVVASGAGMGLRVLELRRYQPLGNLVDVGGFRLHLACIGEGGPTVVVETGSGSWSGEWERVRHEVSRFTRVCAYDRAGYGWSDAGPLPRTGIRITDELRTLLERAGEEPPYILVGHSLGGLYARLYAKRHSDDVSGLVLVDARPPGFSARVPELSADPGIYRIARVLAKVGLLRVIAPLLSPPPANMEGFSDDVTGPMMTLKTRPEFFTALISEGENIPEIEQALLQDPSHGDLPLVVLTHARARLKDLFSNVPAEIQQKAEDAWQELQAEQAALSSRGRLIRATEAGHNIMLDEPDLVVQAIRDMVDALRNRSAGSE